MSPFSICCACFLLVCLIGCMFVIVKQWGELDYARRIVYETDKGLANRRLRVSHLRAQVSALEVANHKLTDKHEAASSRIAELERIVRLGVDGGMA